MFQHFFHHSSYLVLLYSSFFALHICNCSSVLSSTPSSRAIILTHATDCYASKTDHEIMADLVYARKEATANENLRRLLETTELFSNPYDASILSQLTTNIISSAYYRIKTDRLLDSQSFTGNVTTRMSQSKKSIKSHDDFSSTSKQQIGSDLEHHLQADHIIHRRRLSESSIHSRRDRLLAVLEAAMNIDLFSTMDYSDNDGLAYYKKIETRYLTHLQMDIIENTMDIDTKELLNVVSYLPCLESPPEQDSEKIVNDITPTDLRIKGGNAFSSAHQWGLLGPDSGEPYGSNVVKAWELYTGSEQPGFIVGVVDTGCSMHPDLEPNMIMCHSNDPECGGYDFGDNDENPFDEPLSKVHGTPVASIIAAQPGNGFGISGICWSCRIMCLKVFNSKTRTIPLSAVLKAYNYLLKKKVLLSNHSYISFGWSSAEFSAISKLRRAGHLLVVAAGNYACNVDRKRSDGKKDCVTRKENLGMASPAGYGFDNVIAVGSIDNSGWISDFSNWGRESIDIMAPGDKIPALGNTLKHDGSVIKSVSGTSFSCPHVTGIAALVWGRNTSLTYQEVKEIILSTAKPVETLKGLCVTGGIVDAFAALNSTPSDLIDTPWALKPKPKYDNSYIYYGIHQRLARERSKCSTRRLQDLIVILIFFLYFLLSV